MVLLRERTRRTVGFIEPCLPKPVRVPPSGPGWIHEIKHDGFRIMARRDSRGHAPDHPERERLHRPLPADRGGGGGVAPTLMPDRWRSHRHHDGGLAVFDLIRRRQHEHAAVLCAFDLIELDGEDLQRTPIERRKVALARVLRCSHPGIALNEHFDGDGAIIFKHACALGCEGIVSKRLGSSYRSGRADCWVKVKNPEAAAVRREAEEDWSR